MFRPLALAVALAGCPAPNTDSDAHDHPFELDFIATVGGQEVTCGTPFDLGEPAATAQLADARLYISNLHFLNGDGTWVRAVLEADGRWQDHHVALLDFEDGTAGCADSGTAETRRTLTGALPDGVWSGIRFDVGVPGDRNHIDSATAPAPLDAPGMFWVWQSGYKFARFDFTIQGETPARWNTHLGSTGCVSDAPTLAPPAPCGRQNRATITLTDFDPFAGPLALDLGALLAGTDPTANTPDTAPGCMSGPTEPEDCAAPFTALGLDFATGDCVDGCAGQTLFRGLAE